MQAINTYPKVAECDRFLLEAHENPLAVGSGAITLLYLRNAMDRQKYEGSVHDAAELFQACGTVKSLTVGIRHEAPKWAG